MDRLCWRFKQNRPKIDHFLIPLHTPPELTSTCVQNMTKYGLGWFLWIGRKVLDHLSQKLFPGLESETFHPNPLCIATYLSSSDITERHPERAKRGECERGWDDPPGVGCHSAPPPVEEALQQRHRRIVSCAATATAHLVSLSPPIRLSRHRRWRMVQQTIQKWRPHVGRGGFQ